MDLAYDVATMLRALKHLQPEILSIQTAFFNKNYRTLSLKGVAAALAAVMVVLPKMIASSPLKLLTPSCRTTPKTLPLFARSESNITMLNQHER